MSPSEGPRLQLDRSTSSAATVHRRRDGSVRPAWAIWLMILLCFLVSASTWVAQAQQKRGSVQGQVTDQQKRLILNADIVLTDADGKELRATSSAQGGFRFNNLPPGLYKLTAVAPGFEQYSNNQLLVRAGGREVLPIRLGVQPSRARVRVTLDGPLNVEPAENSNAQVWREPYLSSLPQDADSLGAALDSLAGPPTTLEDRQILVDGFSGNRVPPRQSIRDIRIGADPFSAEFDRMGAGRIEILTKPGTDKFHAYSYFNFNDGRMNSRNPFASNIAPFQMRQYGGSISGPLRTGRQSFFLDLEKREADDNAVVNATVLDATLKPVLFSRAVLTPQRRLTVSPRLDLQLSRNHTAVARYRFTGTANGNVGVGGFSLPSRAYRIQSTEHNVQISETAILRADMLLDTRLQLVKLLTQQQAGDAAPTLNVLDAFTGGGATVGPSSTRRTSWELQSQLFWAQKKHGLRFGGRFRGVRIADFASANFGGTYTFGGGSAVRLDERGQVPLTDGNPTFDAITSLERYRRTLLFLKQGLPANAGALTRTQLGFGPTLLSIAGGDPEARVGRFDAGLFAQDDWRVRPILTLSLGLRYEAQTNVSSHADVAPRFGFAWAPFQKSDKGVSTPHIVIRGGFGVFYDRFSESYTLQQNRLNGTRQQQFVVSEPQILALYPQVPSVQALTAFAVPQTVRRVATDIRDPYSLQSSIGIEHRLPFNSTLSVTHLATRSLHVLRSRNINAPIVAGSPVRPIASAGNIFQYESSGRFNLNQVRLNLNSRPVKAFSFAASYIWTRARSDTDGAGTFPANSYNMSGEYGRATNDVRHTFTLNGTVNGPWSLRLSPFVVASSGRPYNITLGRDTNGDTIYTERPAFADDSTLPRSLMQTRLGNFNLEPVAGQASIPRNFGTGPRFFLVNMRLSRSFRINEAKKGSTKASQSKKQHSRNILMNWINGRPYNLTVAVQVQNLFNNTNLGLPTGNLRSTYFGRSNSIASGYGYGDTPTTANRRIELQMQISF
jgi:hypothetical protein